jgi:hypothetical protein
VRRVFALRGTDSPPTETVAYSTAIGGTTAERLDALQIDLWCEQNHEWSVILQPRKGVLEYRAEYEQPKRVDGSVR